MKKLFTLALCALFTAQTAEAKIWRVNNTVGANADFTSLSSAVAAASAGDTLHVEASTTDYGSMTLNKKLVIRGTGYFLSGTPSNPKTQHNKNTSYGGTIYCEAGSKGSVIEGLTLYSVYLRDSALTLQRNNISYIYLSDTRDVAGDTIRHNFLNGIYLNSGNFKTRGLFVYNNIFTGYINLSQTANADGFAVNNTFLGNNTFKTNNFIYQNNIFNVSDFGQYKQANTFLNNVSVDNNLPAGNGNITGASLANLYVGGNTGTGFSADDRYRLKVGSPAIGAGVLNGVAVDCGAFGGPAPYVHSGMPQMPSIYDIVMPSQINVGTTAVTVNVSAAAH